RRQELLRGLVSPSDPHAPGQNQEGSPNAEGPSEESADLLRASDHERPHRRLQQPHPGDQVRRPRLPQLRELPHQNPLLLRQARSHAKMSRLAFTHSVPGRTTLKSKSSGSGQEKFSMSVEVVASASGNPPRVPEYPVPSAPK